MDQPHWEEAPGMVCGPKGSIRAKNPGRLRGDDDGYHPKPLPPARPDQPGMIYVCLRFPTRSGAAAWIFLVIILVLAAPLVKADDDEPRPGDSTYMDRATELLQ